MDRHNDKTHPRSAHQTDQLIKTFYQDLSRKLGSIIDPTEQLSIPELVKRLVTLDDIASQLNLTKDSRPSIEIPGNFRDLNRLEGEAWTGWFKGDGDRVSHYLRGCLPDERRSFSLAMLNWGADLRDSLPDTPTDTGSQYLDRQGQLRHKAGRIIYAGGDDFLGVLYRLPPPGADQSPNPLQARDCLDWLQTIPQIWATHKYHNDISVSIGFVWAAPGVPQRDVLQHCDLAEKAAKQAGKDRVAIRILFNGGNHLQWICPWRLLDVLNRYRDREGITGPDANWTHLYSDIATLQSRHAFTDDLTIIQALLDLYFPEDTGLLAENNWWNEAVPGKPATAGILGEPDRYPTDRHRSQSLQQWAINLAKVGFHLHQTHRPAPVLVAR